ncbi:IclR family transcriptional regulator [Rummeliibacillus pycnus]|uniref:IclR family transcriptional regulator n=1 Tax=Rummeliibacillus pycnus TaxID=101070 RepID=UPI0037CB949B
MNKENNSNNYTMQSVQKAIKVLNAFSKEEPQLSLTELHKKTGIAISSLQRFLTTLVCEGFLHKDERTKQYQLGLSLLFLGRLVEEESSLLTVAKPILSKLNESTGESVSLNVIDGNERRCILNFESTFTLSTKTYVGDSSPLYAGASSKSLLAFLPIEEFEQYLEEVDLIEITENTIISKEQLRMNLLEIRQQGYAISNSERVKGAFSVSAPIRLADGRPVASITIVIPVVRNDDYDKTQLTESVLAASKAIESQLY